MDCDLCTRQSKETLGAGTLWCDDCNIFICEDCSSSHASSFPSHKLQAADAEEEYEDITEEEALRWMQDHEEDPQTQCSRLFYDSSSLDLNGAEWLTDERLNLLRTCGFVVIDGLISAELASAIRVATEGFAEAGEYLQAPALTSAGDSQRESSVRGDKHTFLHAGEAPCDKPPFSEVMQSFARLQVELSKVLKLDAAGPQDEEFQLALYAGNDTGYERHRDAMPDDGQSVMEDGTSVLQRRVTAILYTSEDWQASDGGQLKIWLTPVQQAAHNGHVAEPSADGSLGEENVSVEPVAGRLLLFLSGAVDHSVLPCRYNRTAITAWFH